MGFKGQNSKIKTMIDLNNLKEAKKFEPLTINDKIIESWEQLKKFWEEETGYDLEEYTKNELILYTEEELKKEYLELSGIDEKLSPYLNTEAMIHDDYLSGYLRDLMINGIKHYYRTY